MTPPEYEKWQDLKVPVKKIRESISKLPPPPTPHDEWASKVNALNKASESLDELVTSMSEQEEFREEHS